MLTHAKEEHNWNWFGLPKALSNGWQNQTHATLPPGRSWGFFDSVCANFAWPVGTMLVTDFLLENCWTLVEEMKQLGKRYRCTHLRDIGGGLGLNCCVASNIITGALRGQTWLTCSEPGCDRAVQPVKGIWSHLASKLSSLARDSELNHFLPLKRERRAERLLKEICQSKVCAGLL